MWRDGKRRSISCDIPFALDVSVPCEAAEDDVQSLLGTVLEASL